MKRLLSTTEIFDSFCFFLFLDGSLVDFCRNFPTFSGVANACTSMKCSEFFDVLGTEHWRTISVAFCFQFCRKPTPRGSQIERDHACEELKLVAHRFVALCFPISSECPCDFISWNPGRFCECFVNRRNLTNPNTVFVDRL